MTSNFKEWNNTTPHTSHKATATDTRQVKNVNAISVKGATYRGCQPIDGIFELADTQMKSISGDIRFEVVCGWFGVKPYNSFPQIKITNDYEIIKDFTGEVIDNISLPTTNNTLTSEFINIDKQGIERYFSVDEVIASGGGRSFFRITEILDDRIRIQPTASKTASRLRYDKISAIVNNFNEIDPNRIEITVGQILAKHKLNDTQNESYLYGIARDYLNRKSPTDYSLINREFEKSCEQAKKLSRTERQEQLKLADKKPKKYLVTSVVYQRNPLVFEERLDIANGICEQCHKPAPFNKAKDGSPYLEVHHIVQLAHGGDDTVENTIALCPNCHREKHFG